MSGKIEELIKHDGDVIRFLEGAAAANVNKVLSGYPFPIRRYSKGKWRIIYIICKEVEGVEHPFLKNIWKLCESDIIVVILYVLPKNEKPYEKALRWIEKS